MLILISIVKVKVKIIVITEGKYGILTPITYMIKLKQSYNIKILSTLT